MVSELFARNVVEAKVFKLPLCLFYRIEIFVKENNEVSIKCQFAFEDKLSRVGFIFEGFIFWGKVIIHEVETFNSIISC